MTAADWIQRRKYNQYQIQLKKELFKKQSNEKANQ